VGAVLIETHGAAGLNVSKRGADCQWFDPTEARAVRDTCGSGDMVSVGIIDWLLDGDCNSQSIEAIAEGVMAGQRLAAAHDPGGRGRDPRHPPGPRSLGRRARLEQGVLPDRQVPRRPHRLAHSARRPASVGVLSRVGASRPARCLTSASRSSAAPPRPEPACTLRRPLPPLHRFQPRR